MEYYFILGKGGVGKSTISLLMALSLIKKGKQAWVVSLDQAHNLFDIVATPNKKLPAELKIFEPNLDGFVAEYLHSREQLLRKNYRYLTSLNLEHHFNIIKQTPGMEEYGLILAFEHFFKKANEHKDVEAIIFDLPPTAIALKFFSFPFVSLLWLEQLLKLRNEILNKKEIISQVKFGKFEIETDAIKKNLEDQIQQFKKYITLFQNKKSCKIVLISNIDTISLAESERIVQQLQSIHLDIHKMIINKIEPKAFKKNISLSFIDDNKLLFLPQAKKPLMGLENLIEFAKKLSVE